MLVREEKRGADEFDWWGSEKEGLPLLGIYCLGSWVPMMGWLSCLSLLWVEYAGYEVYDFPHPHWYFWVSRSVIIQMIIIEGMERSDICTELSKVNFVFGKSPSKSFHDGDKIKTCFLLFWQTNKEKNIKIMRKKISVQTAFFFLHFLVNFIHCLPSPSTIFLEWSRMY